MQNDEIQMKKVSRKRGKYLELPFRCIGFDILVAPAQAAPSHVVYGVVWIVSRSPARFNGLDRRGLKPKPEKDVETPSPITAEPDHALKGRGNARKAS